MAAKFEITSGAGRFNWVLKNQGRTLATGEGYARKALAEKAIESLRKAAAGATLNDTTATRAAKSPAPAKRAARRTATKGTAAKAAPRARGSRAG